MRDIATKLEVSAVTVGPAPRVIYEVRARREEIHDLPGNRAVNPIHLCRAAAALVKQIDFNKCAEPEHPPPRSRGMPLTGRQITAETKTDMTLHSDNCCLRFPARQIANNEISHRTTLV